MATQTFGPDPKKYSKEIKRQITLVINSEMLALQGKIISNSPVDVGILKNSWNYLPATTVLPTGILGTTSKYFLPVEMGRAPGKGISAEGQDAVAAWATRVLQVSQPEAQDVAFLLSQKYKRQGRPAIGFAGLAVPGSTPRTSQTRSIIKELPGGLIDRTFRAIDRKLGFLPPVT
ncbi:hypothetical protein AHIS2_p084 [Acaryochloris phage A-HIS2]|nr:hypothetical protein AHIS2_p084 [Acaryochloris phage A-HIS2]